MATRAIQAAAMLNAHFLSDLHIVSPDDPRASLFIEYLRSLDGRADASHLFLLGDIFDLWIADHAWFVERYAEIVAEIRRLRDAGVEIHYFEGNHDLHLEAYWARELGILVHDGPLYVELGGHTLRLEHGDQMDPSDHGYRFLRWFLRTPPVRFLVSNLPQGLVLALGRRASAHSRTYTSGPKAISDEHAIQVIRAHARRAHEERAFDLIISGHVHTRDDHVFERGGQFTRSVNLGTWLDRPCVLRLDAHGARLFDLRLDDKRQLHLEMASEENQNHEPSQDRGDRGRSPGTQTRTEIRRP